MDLPDHIFRAYDIRGIVDEDLNPDVVRQIGLGYGTLMRSEQRRRIAIGHDVRQSSPRYAHALSDGVRDAGVDVLLIGQTATPVLYHAIAHRELDGGVMVTGSHNPVEYNGLKLCRSYWPIWGEELTRLEQIARAAEPAAGRGTLAEADVLPAYQAELRDKFSIRPGYRVAIDCGNGTAGPVIVPLLGEFEIDLHGLYVEPDGTFPNHLPDPEVPRYMQDLCQLVREKQAQVGFGFDGDSDRVGVIDEAGRKKSADHVLLVLARYLLAQEGQGKVIFDVKCTDFLLKDIAARGGTPILWKTGHSIMKEKLREEKALIAGELSGHICVARNYYGYDDAFFAALLLLQVLSEADAPLSELFADIPETHYTPEVKVPVSERDKFTVVAALVDEFRRSLGPDRVITIDGVRATWPDGWALLRASNTTANLTIRVEGRTEEALRRIARTVLESLRKHPVDATPLEEWAG